MVVVVILLQVVLMEADRDKDKRSKLLKRIVCSIFGFKLAIYDPIYCHAVAVVVLFV